MRVLVVNHGFPPRFNAGSEIYSQTLVTGLLKAGHDVFVFSRMVNPFIDDFEVKQEMVKTDSIEYSLHLVNVARLKDRYVSRGVDLAFKEIIKKFKPEIVHFNHLNHLSIGIVEVAYNYGARIVFTLHDFWLSCPRGQFLQVNYGEASPHKLCGGQEDSKCAKKCYSRYFTGLDDTQDLVYWTNWIRFRREAIGKLVKFVDVFISPSTTVGERLQSELGLSDTQLQYLDYGFDLNKLSRRRRTVGEKVVFGYIGTHTISKGLHLLIDAFSQLNEKAQLVIYGRERSETTPHLKEICSNLDVDWMPEYDNSQIVEEVFEKVDVIVVPSIWLENSPLVIHEVLQTRTLVITADAGGMAEYVHDMENGLLFKHRDVESLRDTMQKVVDNPSLIHDVGKRGYLHSETGDVVSIEEHIKKIEGIYRRLC